MNITKENTQFIDQYLKKSEVVFDDLRLELVDHVASAVSFKMVNENLDFYDAFKSYMVENKKNILKAGMVNHTFNFKLAFYKFFNFLILKEVVISAIIVLFLALNTFKILIVENLQNIQTVFLASLFLFSIVWMIVFYGFFKKRFFILENNFFLLTLLFQLMNFGRILWKENIEIEFYATVIFGLLFSLFIVFMCKISVELYRKNKYLYETI